MCVYVWIITNEGVCFLPVSPHPSKLGAYSRIKEELESNKQEFTYAEVLSITKNFEKVVGKGASATVYHGSIDDDTEVAVKMLSPSAQGYMQFQAEVVHMVNYFKYIIMHTYVQDQLIPDVTLLYLHQVIILFKM